MLFDERDLEGLFSPPPKAKPKLTFLKKKSNETWWPTPSKKTPVQPLAHNTANPQTQLTNEEDEETIVTHVRSKRPTNKLVLTLGIVALFLAVINGPALFQNFRWWYITDYQNQTVTPPTVPTALANTDTLTINKLGIIAPIVWDTTEANRLDAMTQGVASLNYDTRPGDGKTVALVGHSNDYWWNGNKFGQVFTLLNHMVVGDRMSIKYQGHDYQYLVTNVLTETPSPEILTGGDTLVLVTTQPTSSKKRLFLIARLVRN